MASRAIYAPSALLLLLGGALLAADKPSPAAKPFSEAAIYIEQNATDKDVEVVFSATSGKIGLAAVQVTAPDGRTIIDFKAPDSKLGIREFNFESPEPANDGSVQADFPAGEYIFAGSTVAGVKLRSTVRLSHELPEPATIVQPAAEAEDVAIQGLVIQWKKVPSATGYVVVVEQEESGAEITAKLSGAATSFAVPDGFLLPGVEYTLGVGTVSKAGNASFVETSLTTAK